MGRSQEAGQAINHKDCWKNLITNFAGDALGYYLEYVLAWRWGGLCYLKVTAACLAKPNDAKAAICGGD